MVEAQLNNEQFEHLSRYALYSSKNTLVCSFNDRMISMLKSNNVDFVHLDENGFPISENVYIQMKRAVPTISIVRNKVMLLQNATPEIMHFCGIRSESDPTVPLSHVGRVHMLLKEGLLNADEKFADLYTPMGYRGKIKDLICAEIKFYGKGRITDFIDGDLTVQMMHFVDAKVKEIMYKCMSVEAVVPDSVETPMVETGRSNTVYLMELDKDGKRTGFGIEAQFFSTPAILRSIFLPGWCGRIACSKIREGRNDKVLNVTDPIILPNDLVMHSEEFVSPPDRKIPADLWRYAYYEFNMRYDMNWRKGCDHANI